MTADGVLHFDVNAVVRGEKERNKVRLRQSFADLGVEVIAGYQIPVIPRLNDSIPLMGTKMNPQLTQKIGVGVAYEINSLRVMLASAPHLDERSAQASQIVSRPYRPRFLAFSF